MTTKGLNHHNGSLLVTLDVSFAFSLFASLVLDGGYVSELLLRDNLREELFGLLPF